MKTELADQLYSRLHAGFGEWLRIMNFEKTSQRDMPKMLGEFLSYLEVRDCHAIAEIFESHIHGYLSYLADVQAEPRAVD